MSPYGPGYDEVLQLVDGQWVRYNPFSDRHNPLSLREWDDPADRVPTPDELPDAPMRGTGFLADGLRPRHECAHGGEIIRDAEEHECGVTPSGHTPRVWQHQREVEQ